MRLTALALMSIDAAIASAVQCVVSPGGSSSVSATTRSATSGARGAIRDGRVLSCSAPPKAFLGEAFLPTPHAGLGLARPPHDLDRADAVTAQQNHPRTPDVLLRRVAIVDACRHPLAIGGRNDEGDTRAHAPDSHANQQWESSIGLLHPTETTRHRAAVTI